MYEYQIFWPFGFSGNSALLAASSLRETGHFVALSFLGGLKNILVSFWTDGYFSSVSNDTSGLMIVFMN